VQAFSVTLTFKSLVKLLRESFLLPYFYGEFYIVWLYFSVLNFIWTAKMFVFAYFAYLSGKKSNEIVHVL
jgi:hypothetical protein